MLHLRYPRYAPAILLRFFFLFSINDLNFLILVVTVQIFNPIAALVIPTGIPSKEAKGEIEIHPLTTEAKHRKRSIQFRVLQTFLCFLLIDSCCSISLMN